MDDSDPMHSFFPEAAKSSSPETVLYSALSLKLTATSEEIRKAYRKLALQYHPDKHTSKSEDEKAELSKQFQRIGFAYAVLGDEGKKKRYDSTGRTDDKFQGAEEMGWDAYFESLYTRVDRKILDDDKKKYQGSKEEEADLIKAYNSSSGSFPSILSYIPHSHHTDEARFVTTINALIASGDLQSTSKWEKTSTDEKAAKLRKKRGEKDAKDAEKAAKELGVWDEFYGDGKKGKRKSTSGGNDVGAFAGEDGEGSLQALILKRQKERASGLDAMEEKYRRIEEEARAKKKARKGNKRA
ncbi:DNAJ domain-containing protein [Kwoniella heveanensis BCC8398]|uniref:DNAJ domain-containing protein n=1 Tax=Kwoniella heveanensis BCC8398 TaxID=1296120 RepID=A0A1B9GNX9_9TREE|nr:DNAJ domain-containing protein [Kwoniella heveanensis BCC8398]